MMMIRDVFAKLCITSYLSLRGGLGPTKQSYTALIIKEIATAHGCLAMTGSQLCKGLLP